MTILVNETKCKMIFFLLKPTPKLTPKNDSKLHSKKDSRLHSMFYNMPKHQEEIINIYVAFVDIEKLEIKKSIEKFYNEGYTFFFNYACNKSFKKCILFHLQN